jgi:Terminase large subunit, T4likevirus-type, N-terminal
MLTSQEILKEYTKGLVNPMYVIETYLETFDKTQEGFVPFQLFPRQREIIRAYEKHRFNLVTKPRQAGVSTTTAAYMAVKVGWADIDNPENILIIANKQELAFEFLAKIKDFLSQLPRWVWGPEYYGDAKKESKSIFITDSKKEIRLPNNSRVKAVATSKDALRGFTPTFLIMDEAAYIDNGAEVFGAALTALGTGGRATLISTPNGMDSLYYKTYDQARTKKNNFNVVEMKWYEDLRYNKDLRWYKDDEVKVEVEFTFESYKKMLDDNWKPTSTWYEQMCMGMNNDAKMIAQELDVSFIGSGGNVIGEEYIEYQEKNNVKEPIFTAGLEQEIWIWEQPQEGHQYVMGVDVSRGDGEDSSTIVVIDVTTMEEVMEYQGKIQPDLLAQIVEEYGDLYKAYTVVDVTGGMGVSTVLKLLEFEYRRLHYDNAGGKILSARQRELTSYAKTDKIPGFHATSVRVPMISNLEYQIRTNGIKVRSSRMISEMKTFIFKNGRPDHMEGYHDDLLMSMGMALWVIEHSFKNLERLEKQTKAMLTSWVAGAPAQNPALGLAPAAGDGFVTAANRNKVATQAPKFNPVVAKNMQDPTGKYMWLFSGSR